MTVEEVATLAKTFGWSYETLMAMPGAERQLWLAAAARGSERVPIPRGERVQGGAPAGLRHLRRPRRPRRPPRPRPGC